MSAVSSALNALRYVPASMGIKLLQKADPRFKSYFAKAAAYGVDVNRALEYLSDQYATSPGERDYKQSLESGAQKGTLRPDQMASRSNLANDAIPGKVLRTGAAIGAGALLGGPAGAAAGALGGMGGEPQQPEVLPPETPQVGYNQPGMLTDQRFAGPPAEDQGTIVPPFNPTERQSSEMNRRAAFGKFQEMSKRKRKEEDEEMKPSLANLEKQFYGRPPASASERRTNFKDMKDLKNYQRLLEEQSGSSEDIRKQQFLKGLDELAKRVGL